MATPAYPPPTPSDLPCLRCTFTQDFHDTVLTSLASIMAGQKATNERLDRINGSVAELFKRTNEQKLQIAVIDSTGSHALEGVRQEVKDLEAELRRAETAISDREASERGASKVIQVIKPALYGVAVGLALLLFEHRDVVLAAIGVKK